MTEKQLGYKPHPDMPVDLFLGPMSTPNHEALARMRPSASTFERAIIDAWWVASTNNAEKLMHSFPWLFVLREDMITDAELWWEEYEEENKVCSTCDGNGSYLSGHYADPNSYEVTCPDCDTHDPDTRDR